VKREKLNPVGSPEMLWLGKAESLAMDAGKRDTATTAGSNDGPLDGDTHLKREKWSGIASSEQSELWLKDE
jgi:hypothetical protein